MKIIQQLNLCIFLLGIWTAIACEDLHAQYIGTAHVLPQIADGTLKDGTGYMSIFLITKLDNAAVTCTFTPHGLSAAHFPEPVITMGASINGYVTATSGTQAFQSGYATVTCTGRIAINTLYTFINAGNITAQATVFSQGEFTSASISAFEFLPFTRIAISLANNSSTTVSYTVNVNRGGSLDSQQFTLAPFSSRSQFLDEMIPIAPTNTLKPVVYITATQPIDGTALLFVNDIFTTVPLTIYQ